MTTTTPQGAAKHQTAIRWTHGSGRKGRTWNPVRGCSIVSPGCTNCYAMGIAARYSGVGQAFEGYAEKVNGHAVWTGKVAVLPHKLNEPLSWREPSMCFVNSMADLFHEDVPFDFIDRVFDVMEQCPQHIFQILTKRPERMRDFAWTRAVKYRPAENIWLGTSGEDQRRADERLAFLVGTPAAVRFLSCEPLLGPVDLTPWLWNRTYLDPDFMVFDGMERRDALHWVITGGESGPRRRPFEHQWARDIRDACVSAGVAYFHKQGSALRPEEDIALDGVIWSQYPDQPITERQSARIEDRHGMSER